MRPVVEPCAGDRPIVKREAERPDEMEGDSQPYAEPADCARVVRDFRPQENDGEILPHDAILERKAGKQLLNRDHQEEARNAVEMGNDSVEEANDERTGKGAQKRRQETAGLFECRSHQAEHSRREHDACRESQNDVVEAMRDFSEGEA